MDKLRIKLVSFTDYLPIIGVLAFVGIYIYSATLYPGGSQVNSNSKGFDWMNNYWCTMFALKAMNGQPNPARPFSIAGMIILWTSLLVFFFKFSEILSPGQIWKRVIQIAGTVSLMFASLLFTNLHDFATTFSSAVGLFALIGIMLGVAKSNLNFYKITGIVCMILMGINNYIYYSRQGINFLPLIQKLTFLVVLSWVVGLNYRMIQIKRKKKFPGH
ncbi:MAG TPA: hypothetical protein VIH57_17930 [Bacteroidales bacterium]